MPSDDAVDRKLQGMDDLVDVRCRGVRERCTYGHRSEVARWRHL